MYFTELSQLTLNYHKLPKFVFGITKLGRRSSAILSANGSVKSFHQAKIRQLGSCCARAEGVSPSNAVTARGGRTLHKFAPSLAA